ncbi:hypothetical protein FT669_18835 [Aeromonas jandaei]|nr:hypothetical protein FT669_18835 [Aeromonas jandaei]
MKIETSNLLNETLNFLASKPFHYDDPIAELFESAPRYIGVDLIKRGDTYHLSSAGISVDMKKQPTSHLFKHLSPAAIRGVSEEKAKELKSTGFAIDHARKRYGINREFDKSTIACGSAVTPKAELYVWLTENVAYMLISQKGEKQRVFYFYKAELLELHNYATKKTVRFIKYEGRGGSRVGAGRKSKATDDATE